MQKENKNQSFALKFSIYKPLYLLYNSIVKIKKYHFLEVKNA